MNTALTIIGLAMFIFIVVFSLKRAKEKNWIVNGIEPNIEAVNHSKKIGVPVINDFFENIDVNKMKKFDAINLFDVLEHVHNPIETLKNCQKLLKAKGIIVIEVPNDYNPLQKIVQNSLKKEEYWLTLLTKSRNYHWASEMDHLNYFNFKSLSRLLKRLKPSCQCLIMVIPSTICIEHRLMRILPYCRILVGAL